MGSSASSVMERQLPSQPWLNTEKYTPCSVRSNIGKAGQGRESERLALHSHPGTQGRLCHLPRLASKSIYCIATQSRVKGRNIGTTSLNFFVSQLTDITSAHSPNTGEMWLSSTTLLRAEKYPF